ncbi:unnamed protein product [Pleuronectes platessa]|uniref:Uncharacterized protein n=1 Tax=Pleuronectes platessa TaxID=8262 RepID=A0A9N7V4M7_PLEPL|nr:unnamed protein product [Pleuronectes platessa]
MERRWTIGRSLDYGKKRSLVRLHGETTKRRTWIDLSKNPRGFSLPCLVPLSKAPYSPNICSPGAVHSRSQLCVLHQMVGVCSPVCVRIGMELRRERYREQMRNLNARPCGGEGAKKTKESFYVRRSVLMTASCPVRSTHTSFAVDR